jgi:hypothetical protein
VRPRPLIGLLLVLLAANTAGADKNKAREHFRKGMAQFLLNHYEQAIPEFEAGFAEEPEPGFLYNLAQSHARLHHTQEALDFYRKYLDMGVSPDDDAQVRKQIEQLEAEAAKAPAARPAPAEPKPIQAAPSPSPGLDLTAPPPARPKTVPIVIGVVAAAVVVAVVVGLAVGLSQRGEPSLLWDAR